MVSMVAFQAADPGSIPGWRNFVPFPQEMLIFLVTLFIYILLGLLTTLIMILYVYCIKQKLFYHWLTLSMKLISFQQASNIVVQVSWSQTLAKQAEKSKEIKIAFAI